MAVACLWDCKAPRSSLRSSSAWPTKTKALPKRRALSLSAGSDAPGGLRLCRESVSRNNPVLDQQEFGRLDQREAAFPLQEGKRRCNWLAPAKRRVAGIGGVIPDLRNRYHAPLFRRFHCPGLRSAKGFSRGIAGTKHFLHSHISGHGGEVCSVDGIAIAQDVSRRLVPG